MSSKFHLPARISFFSWMVFVFLMSPTILSAQPAQLHVSGNKLLTSTGCAVTLKGVDYSGLEINPTGNNEAPGTTFISGQIMADMVEGISEAVTAWHANIIRIPLNQDYWMGCGNSNGTPGAGYKAMIQAIVNYCSQNNVYVMLDLHWSGTYSSTTSSTPCTGSGWGTATAQQSMPDGNAVTFWSSLAATYANNPAVLFDLYNEPVDPTYSDTQSKWAIWANGGQMTGSQPATFTSPGLQALLNAIRTSGANNVVIAGGLNWAFDLRGIVGKEGGAAVSLVDAASGNGIVYAGHVYPSKASPTGTTWSNLTPELNSDIAQCSSVYPVIISEFGNDTCVSGTEDGGTWMNNMTNWISTTNGIVGGIGWDFSTNICPAMFTSWTAYPTNNYNGAPVSEWLATPVPTCPGGPTYTPTNTPTATFTSTATWTNTITNTFTPTNTRTSTYTPTVSNTPTPTHSPVPSNTPTETSTPTNSYSPTGTFTTGPTNTFTLTPIFTYTLTDTPTPTASDTPTWTFTTGPANTSTNTPTIAVPTNTSTPGGPANTSTSTSTPSPSPTATSVTVNLSIGLTGTVNAPSGSSNLTSIQDNMNNASSAAVTLTSLTVTNSGSGNTSQITSISVIIGGSAVGSPTVFSGNTAILNLNNYVLAASTGESVQIELNFTGTANGTFQLSISGISGNSGNNGGQPAAFTGIPVAGYTVVVQPPIQTATSTSTYAPTATYTPSFTPTPAFISQPYPNPVTGPGPVNIDVVIPGQIQWDVFTAAFRKVKGGTPPSGSTTFQWDLTDSSNHPVSNGIYYLRIQVDGYKVVRKILIIR